MFQDITSIDNAIATIDAVSAVVAIDREFRVILDWNKPEPVPELSIFKLCGLGQFAHWYSDGGDWVAVNDKIRALHAPDQQVVEGGDNALAQALENLSD